MSKTQQVEVLSNKDKARTRINVFHDSSSNWINLVKELIGNSLDVFDKETRHHISIELLSNKEITYIDDGLGIPLEGTANTGIPNYEAIFETDFAGSRYGNTGDTIGQNGVFLWTLASTSLNFHVEVARPNGKVYEMSYHKGDRVGDLKVIGKSDKTYTKITFTPDEDVWTNPNYTFEEVSEICKSQASMGNVSIVLKEGDQEQTYCYDNGIHTYFEQETQEKQFVSEPIAFTKTTSQLVEKLKQEFDINIDMVFRFSNDATPDFKKEYLNTADLINYGSINEGIVVGIKNSINRYLKSEGLYVKGEKQIINEDIEVGLNYICNVKSFYVEYVSQSKLSTVSPHMKVAIQRVMEEFLETFVLENPNETKVIANQILINKRSREKANQTRLNIQKKLGEKVGVGILSKIPNLIECKEKDVDKRILCICEGKSSLGAILSGKSSNMAIFPLRGKILNCFKASDDKIYNNDIILGLLQSLGAVAELDKKGRIKITFPPEKLRYGKIYIMVDFDFDGIGSILPLLLTVFYRLCPQLIKENRIYLCETPKYEVVSKDTEETEYAFYDEQLEEIKSRLTPNSYNLHYIKGLAELSKEAMAMCLSGKHNNAKLLSMGEAEKSIASLELWMGTEVEPRKEFIMENFEEVEKW